jgi:hypothetical protein
VGGNAALLQAYHCVKGALLRDPIWDQVNALQAINQALGVFRDVLGRDRAHPRSVYRSRDSRRGDMSASRIAAMSSGRRR